MRDQDEEEYDDLLQKLVSKSKPKDKKPVYFEKKYFDYLPSEDSMSEQSQEKHKYPKKAISVAQKPEAILEDELIVRPSKRMNSRRFKRDAPVEEPGKNKAKRFVQYSVPYVQIYNPLPNAQFYAPQPSYDQFPVQTRHGHNYNTQQQYYSGSPAGFSAYPAYLMYNLIPQQPNIWANDGSSSQRFHPPHNYYLPPNRPQRPQRPTPRPNNE